MFFTHGLFGAVTPSKSQVFVNLWHGDGVKRKPTVEQTTRSLWPATYVSGGTKLLTERKARDFRMAVGRELVFGNPRTVQFADTVPAAFLDSIGVGSSPFVLWMPTFRKSAVSGVGYEDDRITEMMTQFVREAGRRGMCTLVKPHRQDAQSRAVSGAIVIDDHMLIEADVSLYSLLGRSSGLITDFSSVWTDYLVLDRPMAFAVPDYDRYVESRGVYPPDLLAWLPGPRLDTAESVDGFLRATCGDVDTYASDRANARSKLGSVALASPADAILDEIVSRGAFSRRGLMDRSSVVARDGATRLRYVAP